MSHKLPLYLCIFAICTCLIGCGTIGTIHDHKLGVYSGVRRSVENLDALSEDASREACDMYPMAQVLSCFACIGIPFAVIDLPLSLAADTVLLPYTALKSRHQRIKRRNETIQDNEHNDVEQSP